MGPCLLVGFCKDFADLGITVLEQKSRRGRILRQLTITSSQKREKQMHLCCLLTLWGSFLRSYTAQGTAHEMIPPMFKVDISTSINKQNNPPKDTPTGQPILWRIPHYNCPPKWFSWGKLTFKTNHDRFMKRHQKQSRLSNKPPCIIRKDKFTQSKPLLSAYDVHARFFLGTVIFLFSATFTIFSEEECSGPVEREMASGNCSVEVGSPQSTGGNTE